MLAGLLSQSYDARKPSVFVDFLVLVFLSFSGKPQASVRVSSVTTVRCTIKY